MRKAGSFFVAFIVWGAIFFGQAAYSVDWLWIMLTMFFVGYPLSAFVAKKITGIDLCTKCGTTVRLIAP